MRLRLLAVAAVAVAASFVGLAGPAQAADGGLTLGGCISETGSGGACADGVSLNGVTSVTVSSDHNSAYVAQRLWTSDPNWHDEGIAYYVLP